MLRRWHESRALPWLVAALMFLDPDDPDVAEAMAAARGRRALLLHIPAAARGGECRKEKNAPGPTHTGTPSAALPQGTRKSELCVSSAPDSS